MPDRSGRDAARERIRRVSRESIAAGDTTGWFQYVYESAALDASLVPWADLAPHPMFLEWIERTELRGEGRTALVVGSGLGDDAEELARRGFRVTAFDISTAAIEWTRKRFPDSPVHYLAADLFDPPAPLATAFDFVLEVYTIQSLPPAERSRVIEAITRFLAPGGDLVVIARKVALGAAPDGPPWPLTDRDFEGFAARGLEQLESEVRQDPGNPSAHGVLARFRSCRV